LVKCPLLYLQQTKMLVLFGGANQGAQVVFLATVCLTDPDWVGDRKACQSSSGYFLYLVQRRPLFEDQNIVGISSAEAEYIAGTNAVKEGVWLRQLLLEIESHDVPKPPSDLRTYNEEEITNQWERKISQVRYPAMRHVRRPRWGSFRKPASHLLGQLAPGEARR
jgi:hypothetical protein